MQPGWAYDCVVSSLEHSGLESGYSEEAARAGVDLPGTIDTPLVVYAEPEYAIRDLPTAALPGLALGADRREASDWYYLYRHPKAVHYAVSTILTPGPFGLAPRAGRAKRGHVPLPPLAWMQYDYGRAAPTMAFLAFTIRGLWRHRVFRNPGLVRIR